MYDVGISASSIPDAHARNSSYRLLRRLLVSILGSESLMMYVMHLQANTDVPSADGGHYLVKMIGGALSRRIGRSIHTMPSLPGSGKLMGYLRLSSLRYP